MYDVIIIGTGPVGLYSAYYCGFHKLKTMALEHLSFSGGQLSNLYKEKYIYDLPGFDKVTAGDFIGHLEKQYSQFKEDIPIYYEQGVKEIQKADDHFIVVTNKEKFITKSILIATGEGEFKPRPIGVPNTENFKNIHYVAQIELYKDKNIVIFGGGDSAVDFAKMIDKVAAHTTLVHRRDYFRAHEHSIEVLKEQTNVNILTPYAVKSLEGTGDTASLLTLERVGTTHELLLKADYFFVNFGFLPSKVDYNTWGIEATKEGIAVDTSGKTSYAGIYAVGNCCVYPGKIKTIATGLGEVPKAVTAIKRYLNPEKIIGTVYSTHAK